jgi:DNA-binding beta-propeller fold protein YncE
MSRPLAVIKAVIFAVLISLAADTETDYMQQKRIIASWKSAFQSSTDFEISKSFIETLKDLVFGESNISLAQPMGILQTENGDLIVIDRRLGTLIKINREEGIFEYLFDPDSHVFPSLVALCRGPANSVLFTDSVLNCVFRYDLNSGHIEVINNSLMQPTGIGWSAKSNMIWIAETGKHCLTVLDPAGRVERKIGERGSGIGKFNFPNFLHIGRDNLIYVVDAMNFRIQILDVNGNVLFHFGEPGNTSGYLVRPKGISVDASGNIFIADALLNTIQVFDRQGNYLYRFGQPGKEQGKFLLPAGIYITSDNSIYIADSHNARIQEFDLIERREH